MEGVYTVKTRGGKKEIGEAENIVLAFSGATESIVLASVVQPRDNRTPEGGEVLMFMREAAMLY